mmetsp:Transcript_65616/g.201018  ORF Transcript_65616/g.201018 Transcript_65616/m.201018 type:complete len:263 (-) Transcript_65616:183-971(-)
MMLTSPCLPFTPRKTSPTLMVGLLRSWYWFHRSITPPRETRTTDSPADSSTMAGSTSMPSRARKGLVRSTWKVIPNGQSTGIAGGPIPGGAGAAGTPRQLPSPDGYKLSAMAGNGGVGGRSATSCEDCFCGIACWECCVCTCCGPCRHGCTCSPSCVGLIEPPIGPPWGCCWRPAAVLGWESCHASRRVAALAGRVMRNSNSSAARSSPAISVISSMPFTWRTTSPGRMRRLSSAQHKFQRPTIPPLFTRSTTRESWGGRPT